MRCVSIVIITRNRAASLVACLRSLRHQVPSSAEILVVDNNSTDNTRVAVGKMSFLFKREALRYVFEPTVGISRARNRGLEEAKYSRVAFIDDDCLTSPSWISQAHKSITAHPDAAAIIGPNKPYNRINVFSQAAAFFYDHWVIQSINGNVVYNPELLDLKNVALNRDFLQKHGIRFDESLALGEDCDLGIQIEKAGGLIIFNPNMIVRHKHPTELGDFLVKQIAYSISEMQLLTKWYPRQTKLIRKEPMTRYFVTHYILRKRAWRGNVPVLPIVVFIAIMNKTLFFLYKFRPAQRLISFPAHVITRFYLKREPSVV